MKQTVEEAKIKKVKAEMEIARILENLELETGLKSNIVYVYRENAKSEPLSQPKECNKNRYYFNTMIKLRLILRWLLIPLWFAIFIAYLPIWYLQMSWYYFSFQDYWDAFLILWDKTMLSMRLKTRQ